MGKNTPNIQHHRVNQKFRSSLKTRPIRFWYNGDLISKEEHDQLSHAHILSSNNRQARRL